MNLKPTHHQPFPRDRVVRLLTEKLTSYSPNTLTKNHELAKEIEQGMSDASNTLDQYKTLYRKCSANLSSNPNALYVLENLYTGEFKAYDLPRMSHNELNPEKTRKLKREEESEKKAEEFYRTFSSNQTSMLTCRKCKSKKVEHKQLQTRSGDESMTVFCYCNQCGNRWRFS